MQFELIVDSKAFWERLKSDIELATKRVYVQTLSFEGDQTGEKLAKTLIESPAASKAFIIDWFTKVVINDSFIYKPSALIDKSIRQELKATKRLIKDLQDKGIKVHFTNPMGPLLYKFPARNHKKMIVIDDNISYLGGINFCDHNFSWHDTMLRFTNDKLSDFLAQDFECTLNGINQSSGLQIDDNDFFLINAQKSLEYYRQIFELIASAKSSLDIHSPYLTYPCLDAVIQAADNGAKINIIIPGQNNRGSLKNYLLSRTQHHPNVRVLRQKGGMSHLKAILVDHQHLITGSSNFDFVSYYLDQELLAVIRDQQLIREFEEKVFNPDLEQSQILDEKPGSMARFTANASIKFMEFWCKGIMEND